MSAETQEQINQLQAILGKMQVTLGAIADAVVWVAADQEIQWCNRAFAKLLNLDDRQIIGCKFSDLIALQQAGKPIALEAYPNVQIHAGEYETTNYQVELGNQNLWWQISGSYVDSTAVIVIQDITQCQRTEAALEENEAQYRDLVETANCIILRWDSQGNIRFLNDYGQRFFGFELNEIIGRNVVGTIVPETETSGRDLHELMIDICQHPESYLFNENENLCKNGQRQWIVWANKPILDTQGNLIEILSVGTDATARKQAQQELESSLSLLRATFESIHDGILAIDRTGKIVSYNSIFLDMWSIPPEILTEPDQSKRIAHLANQLKDTDGFLQKVRELYATPEANSYDLLEFKDGRIFERYSCPQKLEENILGRVWTFRDITDRQHTEAALKASEARLNAILSSALAAIYRLRVYSENEWYFEYCSAGSVHLWGYSPEELIADKNLLLTRIVPEDLKVDLKAGFAAIFAELSYKSEYRYLHPDESLRWISFSSTSARDAATESWVVTVIATDISNQKRTEAALRESEAKFRNIVENANEIICLVNSDDIISYASPNVLNITGYHPAEMEGQPYSSFIHPDDLPKCAAAIQQVMTTGERFSGLEHRSLYKDGSWQWQTANLALMQDAQGNLQIIGTVHNINEQKLAEAALKASEARLNTILNSTFASIERYRIYPNQEWVIEYCSPGCEKIRGYTAEEMMANNYLVTSRILPEDLESSLQQSFAAIFAERPHEGEYRYRHRDGSIRWLYYSQTSVRDAATDSWIVTLIITDITPRKQTEEALRVSEERLRLSLEAGRMGIWDWNILTNELAWSDNLEPLHGFIPGTFAGTFEAFLEIIHPQDREILTSAIAHAVSSGGDYNTEFRIIWSDGSIHWMLGKGQAFVDATGRAVRMIGVGMDITERKQAEEAVRRSERKYRNIFENSLVGIGRSRLEDGLFLEINQPCAEIIGYSNVADLVGKRHAPEFQVNPDARATLFAEIEQHGEVRNFEIQLRRRDGGINWGLMSARPNVEESCLDFMIVDINDRKRAEQALQRRAQAESLLSRISRHFLDQDLHTAINFTLQAIAEFIESERCCIYEYCDDQSQCYLVYEWHQPGIEPMAHSASNFSIDEFPEYQQQLLQGRAIQSTFDSQNLNPTERNIITASSVKSVVAVPMIHSEKVVGVLLANVVRSIKTWSQEDVNLLKLVGEIIAMGKARHQAEQALLFAKEAAEAANRAKSTFLANMSHELRTPLNAILGFAQLMERDTSLTSKQRESLATINRSGEHLLNLINDVLDMSKIEAGRVVLHSEPFDLHQLLQTIEDMFQIRARAKHLSLRFEIAANMPRYINADEGKLRQVLINLLGNAVKFTSNGTVILRTSAEMTRLDNLQNQACILHFEIEDTGRGIVPAEMDKLFQPFVQTSSGNQAIEGTGLGLAISRQFVRLMGGDINCISRLGRGSTFGFNVQVTLAAAVQETPQFTTGKVIGLVAAQPTYKILVVDDAKNNRDIIVQLLREVGFEVSCANNGEEAIALWETWQPQLIFMDMRMPIMDGYTATREIRQKQSPENTTVIIALTASAFEEEKSTILAAGCNDLIRKPFREQVIFDKLAEHLGVLYLYAPENNHQDTDEQQNYPTPSTSTLRTLLKMMSDAWVTQLYQAANQVDGDRILQLIEQIPENHTVLAKQLTNLNRRFCFDEIIELITPEE